MSFKFAGENSFVLCWYNAEQAIIGMFLVTSKNAIKHHIKDVIGLIFYAGASTILKNKS